MVDPGGQDWADVVGRTLYPVRTNGPQCAEQRSIWRFQDGTTLTQVQACASVTAFRAVPFVGLDLPRRTRLGATIGSRALWRTSATISRIRPWAVFSRSMESSRRPIESGRRRGRRSSSHIGTYWQPSPRISASLEFLDRTGSSAGLDCGRIGHVSIVRSPSLERLTRTPRQRDPRTTRTALHSVL